jgi:8-oxo-dGTP diphosphatase
LFAASRHPIAVTRSPSPDRRHPIAVIRSPSPVRRHPPDVVRWRHPFGNIDSTRFEAIDSKPSVRPSIRSNPLSDSFPPSASRPCLHVAAAVLRDSHGRVLLTQRTPGRDFAGCWEFPGGKLEPGESAQQALHRELTEELGIRIGGTTPLITVPWADRQRRLRLDVHTVASFSGSAHGREGQALQWCEPAHLRSISMPPADLPVVAALTQSEFYAITPEPAPLHAGLATASRSAAETESDARFLAAIDALLSTGIRRLQLRAKTVDRNRQARLAAAIVERTRAVGAELLINGDVELAVALGCGLHLTAAQLAASAQRPAVTLLAASCHDAAELRQAERIGCDFVVLGPVAVTASHPDSLALGWDGFLALREHSRLPVYALGGLCADDLGEARRHGAQGIAAIRAFWPAHGGGASVLVHHG